MTREDNIRKDKVANLTNEQVVAEISWLERMSADVQYYKTLKEKQRPKKAKAL